MYYMYTYDYMSYDHMYKCITMMWFENKISLIHNARRNKDIEVYLLVYIIRESARFRKSSWHSEIFREIQRYIARFREKLRYCDIYQDYNRHGEIPRYIARFYKALFSPNLQKSRVSTFHDISQSNKRKYPPRVKQ